jgi:hypothetical protein
MTPLASKLALELTVSLKERCRFVRQHGDLIREIFNELHFFECTEIVRAAEEVCRTLYNYWERTGLDGWKGLSFLPAPKCWLEVKQSGVRIATFLEQVDDEWAHARLFWPNPIDGFGYSFIGRLSLTSGQFNAVDLGKLRGDPTMAGIGGLPPKMTEQDIRLYLMTLSGIIACINSPRIIGRRQVMPHRKVERELLKAFGPGKFPLQAWTELQLRVAKPVEIADGEPHEAHLTGRRALHFCRKHIRIRNGRLEYVSAHWRGDPALGIKQTRYKLRAPQSSAA